MSSRSITRDVIGRFARVRQRRYIIDEVCPGGDGLGTLTRLSCIDPDDLGRPLEVIWEKELDAEVLKTEDWELLAAQRFDPPDYFAAYYHALRWNRVTASRTDLFQAPFRAGIGIEHYQLQPLRMALSMPRVNLFVADGVGLGKTIEAGLVARELLLRRKISDIVVCCPPSMLLQWREEMETRFGLLFQILDRAYVQKIRRERGFSVNPWATHNRFLISHYLLKDEDYAADLRSWLGRDLVRPRSLLILDEAHHAAPAAGGAYAITSQFTRRIEEIAPKFEHKIFLSATPHNGHSNSFSALMAILDPQRFCRGVKVRAKERNEVLIYRLKDDLRTLHVTFPRREVEPVCIAAPVKGTPELELAEMLVEYSGLREARLAKEPQKVKNASAFLKSGLQQRLLSSVEAFYRTLSKHNETIQEQRQKHNEARRAALAELDEEALAAIGSGLDADEEADEASESLGPAEDGAVGSVGEADRQAAEAERQTEKVTLATLGNPDHPDFAREMDLLARMLVLAERARYEPDEKLKAIFDYIDAKMLVGDGSTAKRRAWNEHRILIFTEYDDTLGYIRRHLEHRVENTDRAEQRLVVFKGSTSLEQRQEIKEAFNADPAENPVRILLATDAAREGLNFQRHCADLFHYDVPWNPARLEQRNGRIDRKLQPAEVVHCRYFLYENRQEDVILRRLVEKTERIYRELGGFGTVLDKQLVQRLQRQGIERARIAETLDLFDRQDPEEERLAALARAEVSGDEEDAEETSRERIDRKRRERLERSLDRLRDLFERSRQWLGFRDREFRAAIDCSLRLMEIEGGLTPETAERTRARRYWFPTEALERNPSWRETLNSLRSPRRRNEPFAAWYARCPIRPIVFEDPGLTQLGAPTGDAMGHEGPEPVHMHLEHRVSQRLLGRFLSQGFVYHDLARACLAQSEGSLPLVYLIGRLCLYGPHATRLHEDLVVTCAEWIRPEDRKGGLQPLDPKRLGEGEAMRRLDDALLACETGRISESRRQELLASADRDVRELLDHVKQKADRLEGAIRKDLQKAGDDEASKTRKLLEGLRDRIDDTLRRRAEEEAALKAKAAERRARSGPALFELGDPAVSADEERIRRERAAERRAMEKRRKDMETEIAEEPDRIRARFVVQTVRLEPVGLVYLWPEKG